MSNEVALREQSAAPATIGSVRQFNLFDPNEFKQVMELSSAISKSMLIPDHFRGKPNDCFIALYRANKLGVNDFIAYMEQTYVVKGKLGHQGKLVLAIMNSCGAFQGKIKFKYSGEKKTPARTCTAYGTLKTGEEVEQSISFQDAIDAGWANQNPLWKTITDRMLAWRSAKWLGDMYVPEIMLAVKEVNELRDASDAEFEEIDDGTGTAPLFTMEGAAVVVKQDQPKAAEEVVVTPEQQPTDVSNMTPVEENASEQPVDTASQDQSLLDLPPIEEPKVLTVQEKRDAIMKTFEADASLFSAFCRSKSWVAPEQDATDLPNAMVEKIYSMLDGVKSTVQKFKDLRDRANQGK